ncbi:MAG: GNAT family N-acetyltransferase [Candidatus Woesearchaeota archaeon]
MRGEEADRMRLEGKDITLRPLKDRDEKNIIKFANDKRIHRFTHMPYPYKKKHAREFIRKSKNNWRKKEEYNLAITDRDDNLIGAINLMRFDWRDKKAELGYWIGKPYRGKGIVPEACRLLINYGFSELKLHRIMIHHAEGNESSRRVIRKLGGKREGRLREHLFTGGKYRDSLAYGILKKEWDGRKARRKKNS